MNKDFDTWNEKKKLTNAEQPRLYTVREVWWCLLGVNIGSEQDGSEKSFLRPALIIRGFGPDACLIVPLTTSRSAHALRVSVGAVDDREARANLSQIRVIDTRRLVEKIGFLDKAIFGELRKTARKLF